MPDATVLIHNGHIFEQAGNLDRALASYRAASQTAVQDSMRSTALRREAAVLKDRCEWTAALRAARESAEIAKISHLDDFVASALNAEAAVHMARGDFTAAVPLFENVLARTGDSGVQGLAMQNLGCIAAMTRDFESCNHYFLDSYAAFRRAGYTEGMILAARNYGAAALDQGDFELAEAVSLRAVNASRGANDFSGEMTALKNYAEALIGQGKDLDDAESRAVVALGFFAGSGNAARRIECLRLLGDLAVMRDDWRAARLAYLQAHDLSHRLDLRTEEHRLAERLDLMALDEPIEPDPTQRN